MNIAGFPSLFGKYILLDRINSGGMAEVFRAKVTGHDDFQKLLAIKCMLPNLVDDSQFEKMFIDEAKLASQLTHANIVQIFELGSMGDRLYIAMELVNGQNLRAIIKKAHQKGVPLPHSFAAYVIGKAALGLDYAHKKTYVDGSPLNIVHRDVSPQNILLSYDGEVKVVDFGIAKAEARATETRAGVLKGKFAYMAPEQVKGAVHDHRADIFALGSVLFEVATGKKLFDGRSDLNTLEKVRNVEVPEFTEIIHKNAPNLLNALRNTIAREPEHRFQNAADLAETLEPLLITDQRQIFGARHAKEIMHVLFEEEITAFQNNRKEYARISVKDCVSQLTKINVESTRVFETSFQKNQAIGQVKNPTQPLQAMPALAHPQSTQIIKEKSQSQNNNHLNKFDPQGPTNIAPRKKPTEPVKSDPKILWFLAIAFLLFFLALSIYYYKSNSGIEAHSTINENLKNGLVIEDNKSKPNHQIEKITENSLDNLEKNTTPIPQEKLPVNGGGESEETTPLKPKNSESIPKEETKIERHKPKSKGKGYLSVGNQSSYSQIKVYINGKYIGFTPTYKYSLEVGNHQLTMVPQEAPEDKIKKTIKIKKNSTRKEFYKIR